MTKRDAHDLRCAIYGHISHVYCYKALHKRHHNLGLKMLSHEKRVFVVFHATTFLAGGPRSHATESHETFFAERVKFVTLSHNLFYFYLAGVARDHFIADQALILSSSLRQIQCPDLA
jgi:hypothetical protein